MRLFNLKITLLLTLLCFSFPFTTFSFFSVSYAQPPAIQLATTYRDDINISDYFISEKLDGIRAYWDGEKLISRQGNTFTAPAWFIHSFPNIPLDGELWIARKHFEQTSGIVRTQSSSNMAWEKITFMIFDLPASNAPFSQRIEDIKQLVLKAKSPYLEAITQQRVTSTDALFALLEATVNNAGEGLMLHHQDALYETARNRDLMKLKQFEDAEATVIQYSPGKGKYLGLLGALVVKTEQGIIFKIGTGFTDEERRNPPPIGSLITYRYTGKTKNNIPRFASFIRVRITY